MSRAKDPSNKRRRKSLLLESFEDRILCDAQPDVALSLPAGSTDVKIGSTVDVTVRFDNTDSAAPLETGYGPYADVIIKATGADGAGAQADDGLSLSSATFLGTPVTTTTLTFDANGQVVHPYARTATGAPLVVDLVALGLFSNDGNPNNDTFGPGDQLLVFQLPFGSTTPEQPAFDINMRLNVSNLCPRWISVWQRPAGQSDDRPKPRGRDIQHRQHQPHGFHGH
jgi:large repetitive protein